MFRQKIRLELRQLPTAAESKRDGFGPAFLPSDSDSSVTSSGILGIKNLTLNW